MTREEEQTTESIEVAPFRYKNPVIPGFYPDPSICRVGDDDFYLVTSTFEYFPGLPVFHSHDMVNWRLIGHALDRPEQLREVEFFSNIPSSGGIYAPTIRYHSKRKMFYIVTTIVHSMGGPDGYVTNHIIISSTTPHASWSDPILLDGKEAPGIDPSLYFDEAGDEAWFCANRYPPGGEQYPAHREIWVQEFDLDKMALTGPQHGIWEGASRTAHATEAPHIYKIGEWFYLMAAEGGTAYHHSVTMARSRDITGPYTGHPGNPFLTHRHLGREHTIVGTGHGDLVETKHGEWWMVLLAMRPYGGYHYNLGRETFLVAVEWEEDGWPVVRGGEVPAEACGPRGVEQCPGPLELDCDNFSAGNGQTLDLRYNFVRCPQKTKSSDDDDGKSRTFWSLEGKVEARDGRVLRLALIPGTLSDATGCPAFVARRLQHRNFTARTRLCGFNPMSQGEVAGLALRQSEKFYFTFVAGRGEEAGELVCRVQVRRQENRHENGPIREMELGHWVAPVGSVSLGLKVEAFGQEYSFFARREGKGGESESGEWEVVANAVDGRILSSPVAGGFVGAYVGMYATSSGRQSAERADFALFEYCGK